ncbi:MAG: hypothetical protein IJS54_07285 [Desulfovibrio sp.]|nr:hypothetical protein [Desulfovibrio sp.]
MDIIKSFFTTFHSKLNYSIEQNECVLTHIKAAAVHPKTFAEYCGIYQNKNIALIACGPTINYAKPLDDTIFVGVNESFRQSSILLDYLFVQDLMPWIKEANNYSRDHCKKFYGIIPQNRTRNSKCRTIQIFDIRDANANEYYLEDLMFHNWPHNIAIEPLCDNGGTVFSAMQFILYTHPKNIYLFGCDCYGSRHFYEKADDNKNFFKYQINQWKNLKTHIDEYYKDINIYSVNPIGLRGIFADLYTSSFVEDNPDLADTTSITLLK